MEIRDTRGRVPVWSMGGGRSGDQIKKFLDDLEHIPDIKCVPDLESVLENKNIFLILNILFKQFPLNSRLLLIFPVYLHSFIINNKKNI